MRLWTIHPRYLDTKGLLAVWREGLLAQQVLQNKTKGYRHHPQLIRFASSRDAIAAIAAYLREIHREAVLRGYQFRAEKIMDGEFPGKILCTRGQLLYEWEHLRKKLKDRDPDRYRELEGIEAPEPHPLFEIIEGGKEDWERGA
jgi:hypothetical protein